jgi:hypothetical protein
MPLTVLLLENAVPINLTSQESNPSKSSLVETPKVSKKITNTDSNSINNLEQSNVLEEVVSSHPTIPLSTENLSEEVAGRTDPLSSTRGIDPTRLNLSLPVANSKKSGLESLAELANKQLGTAQKTDLLAEGIRNSAIADCLHEKQGGGLLGLPIILYKASTGKCQ